jgi:23S rRNA (guanosine2251-2'-O)-methyltransferase
LLFGLHAVRAAWLNPRRRCRSLLVTEAGLGAAKEMLARSAAAGLDRPPLTMVDRRDLDRWLPRGAVHQGVALDALPLEEVTLEAVCAAAAGQACDLLVVLDQVTDPHNVGAILRSASAFAVRAVIVQDRHAPDATGTLAKSASGALEDVPLVRVTNLARALDTVQQAGYWCLGLDAHGARTLAEAAPQGRVALVLGAEGAGLRRLTAESCDEVVRLPTVGPVGSLNVSNAAAVALYELVRDRGTR